MAGAFDNGSQKLKDWKRSPKTIELIDELNKINGVENSHSLIVSGSGIGTINGTWIEENLVLDFAQYLSVKFKLLFFLFPITLNLQGVLITPFFIYQIITWSDDNMKIHEEVYNILLEFLDCKSNEWFMTNVNFVIKEEKDLDNGELIIHYVSNNEIKKVSFPYGRVLNIDFLNVYAIEDDEILRIMPNMLVNISQNSRDRFGGRSYNVSERFENWKEGKLCSLEDLIALRKVKYIQKNVK